MRLLPILTLLSFPLPSFPLLTFSLLTLPLAGLVGGCSGGGDDSVPVDTVGDGFDTSFNGTCSSGKEWTDGNSGSEKMNPGEACMDCHDSGRGPTFLAAGTVMGAIHDPDDCDGVRNVAVTLTDADGVATELSTNAAGNFFTSNRLKTPYTVVISYAGLTRPMEASQTVGDCNSCHTEDGANNAPGRIVVPE